MINKNDEYLEFENQKVFVFYHILKDVVGLKLLDNPKLNPSNFHIINDMVLIYGHEAFVEEIMDEECLGYRMPEEDIY